MIFMYYLLISNFIETELVLFHCIFKLHSQPFYVAYYLRSEIFIIFVNEG